MKKAPMFCLKKKCFVERKIILIYYLEFILYGPVLEGMHNVRLPKLFMKLIFYCIFPHTICISFIVYFLFVILET